MAQQRRLATPEEAREDYGVDHIGTTGTGAMRTLMVA